MSLDKAAVLILTAVVAIFLGIVLFSSDPEALQGEEGAQPASASRSSSSSSEGGTRTHTLDDLRAAVGQPRRGREIQFDDVRKGEFRTKNKKPIQIAGDGKPSQASRVQPRFKTVTVRPNDTLSGIAKRELGNAEFYRRILAANPGLNPSRLQIGQPVRIPVSNKRVETVVSSPGKGASARRVSKDARYHTVKPGETLSGIAYKYYGKASRWQRILDANRSILPRATALREKMVLLIP